MKNEAVRQDGLMRMVGRIISRKAGELLEPSIMVKGRKVTLRDLESSDPEIYTAARQLEQSLYKARY